MSAPKSANAGAADTGKHTPGPWHRNIPPATRYTTVWSGRNTHVARVVPEGLSPEEVEANICLIARAPELVKELATCAAFLAVLAMDEARQGDIKTAEAVMERAEKAAALVNAALGKPS